MRNLDKYDALYGVNLRESLQRRLAPLGLPGESIRFINDVSAYALGEMRFGLSATYLNFCDLVDSRVLGHRLDAMCGLLRENDIRPATAMIADINGISMGQRDALLDHGIEFLYTNIHCHHGMYPLYQNQNAYWWENARPPACSPWSFTSKARTLPACGSAARTGRRFPARSPRTPEDV